MKRIFKRKEQLCSNETHDSSISPDDLHTLIGAVLQLGFVSKETFESIQTLDLGSKLDVGANIESFIPNHIHIKCPDGEILRPESLIRTKNSTDDTENSVCTQPQSETMNPSPENLESNPRSCTA